MPSQMKTTKYNMVYLFFRTKNINMAKWWRNSYIDTYNINDVNRADGCSYHELKVMKNILAEVSGAVTQYIKIFIVNSRYFVLSIEGRSNGKKYDFEHKYLFVG